MSNQYTLKIYPAGMGRDVYRIMEICGEDTLEQLCSAILDAFDFTEDHLYEFCMDNRIYSYDSYQSGLERGGDCAVIKLDDLELCKGKKFSLHYDFGDDWMFKIRVTKITEAAAYHGVAAIKGKGYVSQYPDFDDDEELW